MGFEFKISDSDQGKRLDAFIAEMLENTSRSYAANLIQNSDILVNGSRRKPSYRVKAEDEVSGIIPPSRPVSIEPQDIDFDILFEDNSIIVVNKPPGLVVHPAPGNYLNTLVNGLLYKCPDIEGIGGEIRPGIVHRIDKDTSGVMVVAKNNDAMASLSSQFKNRTVKKKYLTIVKGPMKENSGKIDFPIGRHMKDRKKMSTVSAKPRDALTLWRVVERYSGTAHGGNFKGDHGGVHVAALVEVEIETGRTHQIRVHFNAIHRPILGDTTYGSKTKCSIAGASALASRQMLHACTLSITHPKTEKSMTFEAPLPEDFTIVLSLLGKNKII